MGVKGTSLETERLCSAIGMKPVGANHFLSIPVRRQRQSTSENIAKKAEWTCPGIARSQDDLEMHSPSPSPQKLNMKM